MDYLTDHPLATIREIGMGCHQRHEIITKILKALLKEDKIGALRFPKIKESGKLVFHDTRSYYVKPNVDNVEDVFLKIISSEKIRANRFTKIKYQNRNTLTFEMLIKNAICTFHQEFKIFKLERARRFSVRSSRLSKYAIIEEFHNEFTKRTGKMEEPPEPYSKLEPIEYYKFMFDERYAFAKKIKLRFLKLRKTRSNRLLAIMMKTHEWGDYRHAAREFNLSNKETRRLLDKITDNNGNVDLSKFLTYQHQERLLTEPFFDINTFYGLLFSGVTKNDILNYIYSSGLDYYTMSAEKRTQIDKFVSKAIKDVKKIMKVKRKANSVL